MSKAKCIMVQGTMSGAGKSLLCAALCRIFAQDGYRVAPFKSQNMALNSFVTRDGLEMGRAQVVQAQAAGIEPDVRMNPILLKPSSDVGSQVIVNGEVRGQMSAAAYFKMKRALIPEILSAYNSLAETVDIIVIEGAGSPAEINLKADDIVNMGLARLVDAPVLLAGDIDRGGVFAQLYGTVALLEPEERARIKGLLINKFRGDVEILRPGLAMLEEKTQLPVLGVVPYLKVDIEDEDSLSTRLDAGKTVHPLDAAILRLPHISNFTDFMPLEQHPLLGVRYVQNTRQLGTPDLIILPGTKNTVDDLLWLRQSGLEAAILKLAERGTPILGVCGGYQMLGQQLDDPTGSESGRVQSLRGLGLLPTRTVFSEQKRRTQVTATVTAEPFAWAKLTGYEIHTGRTVVEGTPFVLYVPYLFSDNFQSLDDYDYPPFFGGFVRLLKYFSFGISVFLPGVYVALGTFHQELIPTNLLFTIASAEFRTPLSLMNEAIMTLIFYEIMREAGLRLPKVVGHAVGAIVIGEATVSAGLIGAPILVIIAITAIASYVAFPLYDSVSVLRLLFILAGGLTGLYGLMLGMAALFVNICSLSPYGVPYAAPIAPLNVRSLGDVFYRESWTKLARRRVRVQDLRGAHIDQCE